MRLVRWILTSVVIAIGAAFATVGGVWLSLAYDYADASKWRVAQAYVVARDLPDGYGAESFAWELSESIELEGDVDLPLARVLSLGVTDDVRTTPPMAVMFRSDLFRACPASVFDECVAHRYDFGRLWLMVAGGLALIAFALWRALGRVPAVRP